MSAWMVRKEKGADRVGPDVSTGLLGILMDIQTIRILSKTAGAYG